jgi:hypothetical protein
MKMAAPLDQPGLDVFGLLVQPGLQRWADLRRENQRLKNQPSTEDKFFHLCFSEKKGRKNHLLTKDIT